MLNEKIWNKLPGPKRTYYSIDEARSVDDDLNFQKRTQIQYQIEYLNDLTPSGPPPPHELNLKVGSIVMILRNLSISFGLCNGTRLIIRKMNNKILGCEILNGFNQGQIHYIPRITFYTDQSHNLPFILVRTQLPLKLAFSITINKEQGQTFDVIGLCVERPLFTHGQLYVALSRTCTFNSIFIQCADFINNIVYKEVL